MALPASASALCARAVATGRAGVLAAEELVWPAAESPSATAAAVWVVAAVGAGTSKATVASGAVVPVAVAVAAWPSVASAVLPLVLLSSDVVLAAPAVSLPPAAAWPEAAPAVAASSAWVSVASMASKIAGRPVTWAPCAAPTPVEAPAAAVAPAAGVGAVLIAAADIRLGRLGLGGWSDACCVGNIRTTWSNLCANSPDRCFCKPNCHSPPGAPTGVRAEIAGPFGAAWGVSCRPPDHSAAWSDARLAPPFPQPGPQLAPVLRLTTRPHRLPEGTMLKTNKISRRLVWAFVAAPAEIAEPHVSLCRAET